jgi:hypothetical protein
MSTQVLLLTSLLPNFRDREKTQVTMVIRLLRRLFVSSMMLSRKDFCMSARLLRDSSIEENACC